MTIALWQGEMKVIKFDDQLEKIKETQRQISKTNSSQRKYELHRHLNKLWKEYRMAQRYFRTAEER